MLALSVGAVVTLVISSLLASGFGFALATESDEHMVAGSRSLLERLVREVGEARGHEVFADLAGYEANAPLSGGAPGACLRLYSTTGDSLWWWDSAAAEVRYRSLAGGPSSDRVGAREVRAFQVRCLAPERVGLSVTAVAPDTGSDIPGAPLTLSTSAWHRNFDGSRDSCQAMRSLAMAAP